MKRIFILGLACVMLLLCGCGAENAKNDKKEQNLTAEQKAEKEGTSVFYQEMQENTRPFAVMIDNDTEAARPQMGLESAYLVYEAVVEGSATRFMALFKDIEDMEKVGPVRSSRHYFLDYALENDAIYAHAGWTDRAAAEITSRGVNNINGLYEDSAFYRDNTYDNTWHNLYLNPAKVSEVANNKKYRRETDVKLLTYHENHVKPDGEANEGILIPYADFYKVEFTYNTETKLYDRFVNGAPHKSQTGDGLTAKNIIVYYVQDVPLNDGIYAPRRNLLNTGKGEGYYLSEGVAVPITWEKATHDGQTVYKTADGKDLVVNPGNTYIQLVPTYITYTLN